jgi:hypothetical protein
MNKAKAVTDQMNPDDVVEFLAAHSDFFVGREQLLQSLTLVQDNGNTVSLVERQASMLREQNAETRSKLDELLAAAESNHDVFDKCRALILSLISSHDSDSFFSALENSFNQEFKSTAYSLIIFGNTPRQINHFTSVVNESSAAEYVGALMRATEPTMGVLRPAEQDFLFRHASDKVRSAAVLAVRIDEPIALLAIGSEDKDYFKSGLGTLFIGFVADALALLLPRHIDH